MPDANLIAAQHYRRLSPDRWPDTYSSDFIYHICCLTGSPTLLVDQLQRRSPLQSAIARSDTAALFDWLMRMFSYQGISDQVALGFMEKHGSITYSQVTKALASRLPCPKLGSFWNFYDCGYEKSAVSCSEPSLLATCPLPAHPLRNGRLNQTAYSMALFLRDVVEDDLVAFIDAKIRTGSAAIGSIHADGHELVEAFRGIFGVSDKIIAMALSSLLLAAPKRLNHWHSVGAGLIVVDTLVHNFLDRTGVLRRANADHPYGPKCYEQNGCASTLRALATTIDASRFNPRYPTNFPRFVQNAIWRYCSQDEHNVCNGNKIDDRKPCANQSCRFFATCDRLPLKTAKKAKEPHK